MSLRSTLSGLDTWQRVYDELRDTLRVEQRLRSRRTGMFGSELAWVVKEREAMTDRVNTIRARQGWPPVPMSEVERVERQAVGHIDYTHKFALYCADLATTEPHPCGDAARVTGCGGCDPGAMEYVITDEGVMRAFDPALDMQDGEKP